MRLIVLSALAVTAFSAGMAVETRNANAVVYCAAGVYRAGCVARPAYGVGVVRPAYGVGVVRPGYGVGVRGVARRTTRRVVRRSDMMLKHDIALIGHLQNGLGFYRFAYNGSDKAYVGVMAQEVQTVMPAAVVRGNDGYLRVSYDRIGVKFQSYDQWVESGSHMPAGVSLAN